MCGEAAVVPYAVARQSNIAALLMQTSAYVPQYLQEYQRK
jgi:hypothetical protein